MVLRGDSRRTGDRMTLDALVNSIPFEESPIVFKLWVWCCWKAASGVPFEIGRASTSRELGVTSSQVRTATERLETLGLISVDVANGLRQVTRCGETTSAIVISGDRQAIAKQSPSDRQAVAKREPGPPFDEIAAAWNHYRGHLKKCRVMSDERKKVIRTRWKDEFWRENWREAIMRVSDNPFNDGVSQGGWIAGFDWFLRPNQVASIMEFEGADGTQGTAIGRRIGNQQAQQDVFARFVAGEDGSADEETVPSVDECPDVIEAEFRHIRQEPESMVGGTSQLPVGDDQPSDSAGGPGTGRLPFDC